MKKVILVTVSVIFRLVVLFFVAIVGAAFIYVFTHEGAEETIVESTKEAEVAQVLVEQSFGSYEIPSDWYEDTKFVPGAVSYIKENTIISKPFNSVTILEGNNSYTAEEHEKFREAILKQLNQTLPKNKGIELEGKGIETAQGYHCYIFEIKYPSGEYQKQAYIVGEKRYCQVDEMNMGTGEESDTVFQGVLDSFVWSE